MRLFQTLLALFLLTLFLAFSFNAYACLIPIYGGVKVNQGSDCTKPGEEPAAQFCNGFKSLAFKSSPDVSSAGVSHSVLAGNIPSLFPDTIPISRFCPIPEHGQCPPPKDMLVLISVFRI
jgi:hypothetical protein